MQPVSESQMGSVGQRKSNRGIWALHTAIYHTFLEINSFIHSSPATY